MIRMVARVDESKCTGCGMCSEVCPVEAITVDQVARIDAATCISCGSCVTECPDDAISMEEMETASSVRGFDSPPFSQITPTRDLAPTNPSWTPGGQTGFKQINEGGFLGRFFRFLGRPTGQDRKRGKGRGRRRGRGRSWRQ